MEFIKVLCFAVSSFELTLRHCDEHPFIGVDDLDTMNGECTTDVCAYEGADFSDVVQPVHTDADVGCRRRGRRLPLWFF